MRFFLMLYAWYVVGLCCLVSRGECVIHKSLLKDIDSVNKVGSYIGVVVPNGFEMNPLLQSSSFIEDQTRPYLDISGKPMCMLHHEFMIHQLHDHLLTLIAIS
ncbi:hypothetical protein Hanom_Chr10g00963651 [Helianthus anomalus]